MAFATPYTKDAKANEGPARKKLKTSDLPLASATRAAIESLALAFKKKGNHDVLRKQIWHDLESSNFEEGFKSTLLAVAEEELDKNTSQLLKLDRNKAALLIEGAVDRAGVYGTAEQMIDQLIDAHIEDIEKGVRSLREKDIGEEAARAEQLRGGKTDEQYAAEAAEKRAAREEVRTQEREKERVAVEERRKIDKARRREEEKKIEIEQEKKRAEREARRKAEDELRSKEREREREKEKERDRERDRTRDRDRGRGERDRDRDYDRDHDRSRRHDEPTSRRDSIRDGKDSESKSELTKEDIERLEQEALNDLLKEGKRVSQRSRHQVELEVDRTLAPPPRKTMPASAIKPISRDSPTAKTADSKKTSSDEKAKEPEFKPPAGPSAMRKQAEEKPDSRDRRTRSRSREHHSVRRSSRDSSRSRRKDDRRTRDPSRNRDERVDKEKDSERTRRASPDRGDRRRRDSRDRDDRRRRDSRDRDDRPRRDSRDRTDRRDRDRDRDRSRSRDRRRSYRSRSRSRDRVRDRARARTPPRLLPSGAPDMEPWKKAEVQKREEEAKAYLAAQKEAREKGLPIPGWNDRPQRKDIASTPRRPENEAVSSPVSTRTKERDLERDRDIDRAPRVTRGRSRSRTPIGRRGSRTQRSTSPLNIDRYVPGASSTRRGSTVARSPVRRRDRSRDRDRDRRTRDDDEDRPRRRSRSRSRRRDRSRDRERTRARSRSRSPYVRKERESRRERSRSRDRERRRDRSRSRNRDRDRRRSRS